MKRIEYYYNVIYYFFYRGSVQFIYDPSPSESKLMNKLEETKFMKKINKRLHIDNPKEHDAKLVNKIMTDPSLSFGTMYGAGFSIISLTFIYIGFYKIIKNLVFPDFQDSFGYILIIADTCAWFTHIVLSRDKDQGEKYIKKFNQIKDKRWRRKWAFITALTFPLSISFMVLTSKSSYIGGFFYAVHQYLFH